MDEPGPPAATTWPTPAGSDDTGRTHFHALYLRLQRLARRELRRAGAHGAINTTTLVHEAWLKLDGGQGDAAQRGFSPALAARAMRCALVDTVRHAMARKRGGGLVKVTLQTDLALEGDGDRVDLLAIERGLRALEAWEPRLAAVVECRFYGGMRFQDIATALGVDPRTVNRDWHKARAFLLAQLGGAAA